MRRTTLFIALTALLVLALVLALTFLIPSYPDLYTERPVLGNKAAPVKLVEYADAECPACRLAFGTVQSILLEFNDSISYEYRHFPLDQHTYALRAAIAAECANDYGKYYAYIDKEFTSSDLSTSALVRYARELGIPTSAFSACLKSPAKNTIVDTDVQSGIRAGITGTPTLFLNGKMLNSWQYNDLKAAILAELNATTP